MSATFPGNRVRSVSFLNHMSDENLVAQAKLGREQAFIELWSRHGERIRAVVRRIIRNREDAEDILQEAYLNSFLHLVTFNGQSQFATWLTRIAINLALMLLRKQRRHPAIDIGSSDPELPAPVMDFPDTSESVESRYFHAERLHQLRCAIRQLPPGLRNIIELQNRDELPLKEIAHRTGLSEFAVKSRLVRARDKLRELTSQGRERKSTRRLRRASRDFHRLAPSIG
jgi:RNA polymerase sigma-70 factor, ECF subfamily